MQQDIDQARKMLDTFTSVGATRFNVTFLDIFGAKTGYFPARTIPSMRYNLPSWMARASVRQTWNSTDGKQAAAGENLVIRPVSSTVTFVQLDDLSAEQLECVKPAAFLIHATSPGNHQAWLAVSGYAGETSALARRVRKALGAGDQSASGATRLAGTENFKTKYAPNFPVITITHAAAGQIVTPEQLQQMGLFAEPEPIKPLPAPRRVANDPVRRWPSYQIALARAKLKPDGTPDRSDADFSWSMICITGGKDIEETIARLLEVSESAQERAAARDPGYARVTVEKAARFVNQRWGNNRGRA